MIHLYNWGELEKAQRLARTHGIFGSAPNGHCSELEEQGLSVAKSKSAVTSRW